MEVTPELIRRARDELPYGTQAFSELARVIYPTVRSMAFGIVRDWDDADQISQDSMLRVMRGLPKLEDDTRFFGWLNRIVVNVAYTFIGREQRERQKMRDAFASEVVTDVVTDHDVDESDINSDRFEGLMASLNLEERTVLALRFVNDMEFQEIAEVTGAGLSATKMRFYRALEKLKRVVGDRDE